MNYENEIWKDIIIEKNGVVYDYTGLYEVSNYGRVRSLDRIDSLGREVKGRIMKLRVDKSGYIIVGLCKSGEKQQLFSVHRLVATAFIPNLENLPVVNHKNECKTYNVWTNLEWCTEKYNTQYSAKPRSEETKRKISESCKGNYTGDKHPKAKKVICIETEQVFNTMKDAEQWCGKKGVSGCCRGISKTVGGYHWQFLDDYRREQRKQSDINNSMAA